MATFLQNLITARDTLAAELVTVTANPKRSYSVNGRSFDHAAYEERLIMKIENLQKQIFALEGDTEIRTIALS